MPATLQTYKIEVSLMAEEGGDDLPVKDHSNMIIAWYHEEFEDFPEVEDFKIRHLEDNLFEISYIADEEDICPEGVAAPDDDGNHPIEIDGVLYLVDGSLQEED